MYNIRLKEIRVKKDLTIREVANILHVSKSTYSAYENNINTITITNLLKFCKYFHVSADYALGNTSINRFNKNASYKCQYALIGSRIKKIIDDNHLTQDKFGSIINLPQSSVNAYIHGKTKIKMDAIVEIVKNFNCSYDYLLGITNYTMVIPN